MKSISEKKITLFYILSITLLATVLTLFYINTQNIKATTISMGHAKDVLHESDNVLLDILNIETGGRGFLLSGHEIFLEPFTKGVNAINDDLAALMLLAGDNPARQKQITALKQLAEERIAITNRQVEARRQNNNFNDAQFIPLIEEGRIISGKVKSSLADINTEEFGLIKVKKEAVDKGNLNLSILFFTLVAFIVVILLVVVYIIRNQKIINQQLEEAKIKAETATRLAVDAVKSKQQFLSNMSHEIRTPMNAIIGFTKVMLKSELTTRQKEYLTAIKMSGDALIVLINDILDLAKVDAGKMVFLNAPFKMELSISAMLHLFEIKIQEKNLELVKEYDSRIPPVLLGDSVRLHQVILNLVSNAVKFTSKGKITVSVRLLKEDEEQATIEFAVSDTGIGIAEDKLETIFENFQQASSGTSRIYGGTGLGLAIVKQLVEAQHGTISVKSKVQEGSVFSFILNFQKTDADVELEPDVVELKPDLKNIRILVAEDMALNQLLVKTLLDDFGFQHDIAANGKIAIEMLEKKPYDVILMDLQMPEMNGFEATAHIRNKMNSKIPIIALTADVTTVDLAKCKAVGMHDYLAKPFDERLLYNKIIGSVKKSVPLPLTGSYHNGHIAKLKCIDLAYLTKRTKSNPQLMMDMISAYLEQTPPLVKAMNKGLKDKDWKALYAAVHKMIPSFSIMGISVVFEEMAKNVQEYAITQQYADGIPDLVLQIENVCTQACLELKEEFNTINNAN